MGLSQSMISNLKKPKCGLHPDSPDRALSHCASVLSHFSHMQLCVTLWTVACQAPLFMGFSRQEYWSGLPFSPPRDLPDPGIEPESLTSPALAGRFFTTSDTWEALFPNTRTHFRHSLHTSTSFPSYLQLLLGHLLGSQGLWSETT